MKKNTNKLEKNTKKICILLVYLLLIAIQLAAFTPYKVTETHFSSQNVPHTIVIKRGFDTISEIGYSKEVKINKKEAIETESIDYSIALLQFALTTGVSSLAYFLLFHKRKNTSSNNVITEKQLSIDDILSVEPPYLNFNELYFADEETIQLAQQKYAEDLYDYIKNRLSKE